MFQIADSRTFTKVGLPDQKSPELSSPVYTPIESYTAQDVQIHITKGLAKR